MNKFVEQIRDALSTTYDETLLLLIAYRLIFICPSFFDVYFFVRFNKEKLIGAYVDDSEKVRLKAGIALSDVHPDSVSPPPYSYKQFPFSQKQQVNVPPPTTFDSDGTFECPSCACTYPKSKGLSLSCGHYFCTDCFADYLNTSLARGPGCVMTPCPMASCPLYVPPSIFMRFCGLHTLTLFIHSLSLIGPNYKRYIQFVLQVYIEGNREMRFNLFMLLLLIFSSSQFLSRTLLSLDFRTSRI